VEFLQNIIDIFLHLDQHLGEIIRQYGAWTYGLLFLIIFCETGLVVTPFLPGDSLLFVAGAFAATGSFQIELLWIILVTASMSGDSTNYFIGRRLGARVFERTNSRIFKRKYLDRTQQFYEKYGGKTMIIARFVPIVRTFAPFLAGVGKMKYRHFVIFIALGAIIWVSVCTLSGYFFGNLPFVRKNFGLVIVVIIVISTLPTAIELLRHKLPSRKG